MYIYLVCKIDVAARSNQQRRHAFMPVSRRSVQSRFSILFFLNLIIHIHAATSSSAAAAKRGGAPPRRTGSPFTCFTHANVWYSI